MRAKTYDPKAQVRLFKTVDHTVSGGVPFGQRFRETAREIDLAPFVMQGGAIRTNKSISEPAGSFTITLADRPVHGAGALESLYGLIEPMDMIEIRMRHGAPVAGAAAAVPIIMRGFVSEVTRTEQMGGDGRPLRTVTVNGMDYGKLWTTLQIHYGPNYVTGQDILSRFKMFERFGGQLKIAQSATEFVTQTVEQILNPFIAGIIPQETSPFPPAIRVESTVRQGTTSVTGPQNKEGSIFDLLRSFTDVGPWNELFLEDREDGVYCVFRPNPALGIDGAPIDPDSSLLPTSAVTITDEDVIAVSLTRTDANVANYYWVRGPRFDIQTDALMKFWAMQALPGATGTTTAGYANSAALLYGIRIMEAASQMGPTGETNLASGLPKEASESRDNNFATWLTERRRLLIEQNKDNVLLERGTMRLRGNEAIRPGSFLRLRRGETQALYYVTHVDHLWEPMQGYFTTVAVERGLGFVERVKAEAGRASPYLAELRGVR